MPALPIKALLRLLPVPFIAPDPVNVRFSTFAARVQVNPANTVSVPALANSVMTSAALSTV